MNNFSACAAVFGTGDAFVMFPLPAKKVSELNLGVYVEAAARPYCGLLLFTGGEFSARTASGADAAFTMRCAAPAFWEYVHVRIREIEMQWEN